MSFRLVLRPLTLSDIVHGRNLIEVDFGAQGGLLPTPFFQANQLCVDIACALPPPSFAANLC